MNLDQYIDSINKRYKLGNATKHTFRGDLQQLIESIVPDIRATNELGEVGKPNLITEIVKKIEEKLGMTFVNEKTPPNIPKGEEHSLNLGQVGEVKKEGLSQPGYITANPKNYLFIKEMRDSLKVNPTEVEIGSGEYFLFLILLVFVIICNFIYTLGWFSELFINRSLTYGPTFLGLHLVMTFICLIAFTSYLLFVLK